MDSIPRGARCWAIRCSVDRSHNSAHKTGSYRGSDPRIRSAGRLQRTIQAVIGGHYALSCIKSAQRKVPFRVGLASGGPVAASAPTTTSSTTAMVTVECIVSTRAHASQSVATESAAVVTLRAFIRMGPPSVGTTGCGALQPRRRRARGCPLVAPCRGPYVVGMMWELARHDDLSAIAYAVLPAPACTSMCTSWAA